MTLIIKQLNLNDQHKIMKKPFRIYIAVLLTVLLFILYSGLVTARQGDIIIETETLSMTGKREHIDNKTRDIPKMRVNEKIIITDQITYTGNRSKQQ